MSYEYLIDDFLVDIKTNVIRKFKILFIEKFIFTLCVCHFSLGLFFSYGWACQSLNLDNQLNKQNEDHFWLPLAVTNSVMNTLTVLLIGFYYYMNFKYRNFIEICKTHQPEILFMICLPMFIFLISILTLGSIKSIMAKTRHYGDIVFDISGVIFYVAILILLIEIRNGYDTGEVWQLSMIKLACILYSSIGLINYIIFNITMDQITNYKKTILGNNYTFGNYVGSSKAADVIFKSYKKIYPLMIQSIYLGSIVAVVYMFEPFKLSYKIVEKAINYENEFGSITNSIHSKNWSVTSIFLSTIIILSTIISAIVKDHCSLYYQINGFLIHLISLVLMGMEIQELKFWKKRLKPSIIDQCFIVVGLIGGIVHCVSSMVMKSQIINDVNDINIFFIIRFTVEIIQCICQTVLGFLLINLENHGNFKNKLVDKFCPIFCLCSINIALLIGDYILINGYEFHSYSKTFNVQLLETGFYKFGKVFLVFLRFHASLLFGRYIFVCE